jgi:hypothetical protein
MRALNRAGRAGGEDETQQDLHDMDLSNARNCAMMVCEGRRLFGMGPHQPPRRRRPLLLRRNVRAVL